MAALLAALPPRAQAVLTQDCIVAAALTELWALNEERLVAIEDDAGRWVVACAWRPSEEVAHA